MGSREQYFVLRLLPQRLKKTASTPQRWHRETSLTRASSLCMGVKNRAVVSKGKFKKMTKMLSSFIFGIFAINVYEIRCGAPGVYLLMYR